MSIRLSWSYTDKNGIPQTERISIHREGIQAEGEPATSKVNPNANQATNPFSNGWIAEKPAGPEMTYQFARLDTMLTEIEAHGMPSWSQHTNYYDNALVWGSDNELYKLIQDSGPVLGGAKDPIAEPAYWRRVFMADDLPMMIVEGHTGADSTFGSEWDKRIIDVEIPTSTPIVGASLNAVTYEISLPPGLYEISAAVYVRWGHYYVSEMRDVTDTPVTKLRSFPGFSGGSTGDAEPSTFTMLRGELEVSGTTRQYAFYTLSDEDAAFIDAYGGTGGIPTETTNTTGIFLHAIIKQKRKDYV